MADLRDIQSYIKAMRNAIKLIKDINQIRDDSKVFQNEEVEMNLLVSFYFVTFRGLNQFLIKGHRSPANRYGSIKDLCQKKAADR